MAALRTSGHSFFKQDNYLLQVLFGSLHVPIYHFMAKLGFFSPPTFVILIADLNVLETR